MERNEFLPKAKEFKHVEHFNKHLFKLLAILYPTAKLSKGKIVFQDDANKGITIVVSPNSLYPNLSKAFREDNVKFSKNGIIDFEEVNTTYQWTGSSGLGYMYPCDRSMFQDCELGMEQKACFFVVVIQIVLQFLKTK